MCQKAVTGLRADVDAAGTAAYIVNTVFSWDASNEGHVARHGIAPGEVEEVLQGVPVPAGSDDRGGETRFRAIGETARGRVLVVVYVEREGAIRPVTAFPANRQLRKWYAEERKAQQDNR